VVPLAIRDHRGAADRVPGGASAHAERDPAADERHAEVALIAVTEDVAVEDDVAGDPSVGGVTDDVGIGGRGVLARERTHPPLEREAARAHIRRRGGSVDPDLDAVDPAGAIAVEAQRGRRGHVRSREPGPRQQDRQQPSG
jgi:hypothetical protein